MSSKNGWRDEEGRVFVYMTVKSIEEAMGCAHQKACGLLAELEDFGLIERQKQGLGKPARIFVKNFVQVWNSYLQTYENHTSGGMEISTPEVCKSAANNTDSIILIIIKPILSYLQIAISMRENSIAGILELIWNMTS